MARLQFTHFEYNYSIVDNYSIVSVTYPSN